MKSVIHGASRIALGAVFGAILSHVFEPALALGAVVALGVYLATRAQE